MIKKTLNYVTADEILNFEERQIENMYSIISLYSGKFKKFNCFLELEFIRRDKKGKVISGELKEDNIVNGYSSNIAIFIKMDGCFLSFNTDDDEGILSVCSNIVYIERSFTQIYVKMFEEHEDVIEDLDEYLENIEKFGVRKSY